jgi:glycosyltransferase involved in cell wall biosynthesis
MNPKVSVVVPTYNRKDLLSETIESVLRQTYKDYEILVVDDGSDDGTAEMIQAKFDQAVRYLRLPHRGLPACPRNAGIQAARGEWVAFLDSDDLWLPHKLEKQMAAIERNPSAVLDYGLAEIFDDAGSYGTTSPSRVCRSGMVFEPLLFTNFIPLSTVLVQKEIIQQAGLFDTRVEFRATEDYDLWLRIAYGHPVHFSSDVLVRYRVHPENILGDPLPMYQRWERVLQKTFAENDVPLSLQKKAYANIEYLRFKHCGAQTGQKYEAVAHLRNAMRINLFSWRTFWVFGLLAMMWCGGASTLRKLILLRQARRRVHESRG